MNVEASDYENTNEVINRLLDDESLWIVTGPIGRRPIIADTEEAAVDEYVSLAVQKNELELDDVE